MRRSYLTSWSLVVFLALFCRGAFSQLPPVPQPSERDAGPRPRIEVDESFKELGKIIAGDRIPVAWALRNIGDAPLTIQRTHSSCGCTVVELADEEKVIPPGGSIMLRANFNSAGRKGDQTKIVTVFTDDPAEPSLQLKFHVFVDSVFVMKPPGQLNLRTVKQGQSADQTLDITPDSGHESVELLDVALSDPDVLSYRKEPLPTPAGMGVRLRFAIAENAPIGRLLSEAKVRIRVGELERNLPVTVFAEIVPDIVCLPDMVKPPRGALGPGHRLTPVAVHSVSATPFDIVEVTTAPFLDVAIEQTERKPPRTHYTLTLTVNEGAPPGPFGTWLHIRTDMLDQPAMKIPIFGLIAPPVEVEPELVILAQGATSGYAARKVRLEADRRLSLQLTQVEWDRELLDVEPVADGDNPLPNVRYLNVRVRPNLPAGVHERRLIVHTNVPDATRLEIPVRIIVSG